MIPWTMFVQICVLIMFVGVVVDIVLQRTFENDGEPKPK
jgi:hypothetical protein